MITGPRITLESIGEGVITTDLNGTIDYMNEAAEQLVGGTRATGIGKRFVVNELRHRSTLSERVGRLLAAPFRVNFWMV